MDFRYIESGSLSVIPLGVRDNIRLYEPSYHAIHGMAGRGKNSMSGYSNYFMTQSEAVSGLTEGATDQNHIILH